MLVVGDSDKAFRGKDYLVDLTLLGDAAHPHRERHPETTGSPVIAATVSKGR
ncbi:MAG: hypothetical protein ABIQ18_15710 [Umezawaea sp.]